MIPSPWEAVILALACYRLTRLAGWDDFPLAVYVREKVEGRRWIAIEAETEGLVDAITPGKTPTSEVQRVRPAFDRPKLAHMIHCPFCMGWWISLAAYLVWLASPTWAMVFAVPWAVSGVVGLIAKNLDG